MKPFNLEEYLANPNRKVITRDGRNVRISCTDAKGDCPIVGLVDCNDTEIPLVFTEKGRIGVNCCDDPMDLFFDSEKHEGWVNIYEYGRGKYITSEIVYTKKEDAIMGKNKSYLTTIKIEWEE